MNSSVRTRNITIRISIRISLGIRISIRHNIRIRITVMGVAMIMALAILTITSHIVTRIQLPLLRTSVVSSVLVGVVQVLLLRLLI